MNDNPYETPNSQQYVMRDDDPYRNAGMPYANPNEQPLLVPKRFGFGWSFNPNNPKSVMLFLVLPIAIIVFILVMLPVLILLLVHH